MAVQRRENFPSQIRVDVPAMRAIESAVSSDFDTLFQAMVTGTSQGYVMRGFDIIMTNAIGNSATSLQMQVDPGALLHIAASQSGTMYLVPSGMANQVLNSATNTNVTGSFTPGAINYVTVDYTRFLASSTNVQGYFWDPSSNTEFTEIVPSAQIMQFVLNVSTTTPAPNQLPLAIILTDSSNLVISITDARWMFCSLGTGGLSPDPFFNYPWTQGRTLTSPTTTSDSINPFVGGDKSIGSLKELLNAIMSVIKEVKGTPYWFSESSTSTFPYIYQNAALNALSGGTWVSPTLGTLQLHGGATLTRFGFENNLVLGAFGPSLGPDGTANTATVTDNTNVSYTTAAATTTNIGDTITIASVTRIVTGVIQTSPTLEVEVADPGFTNGVGLSATLTHYASFNLTADPVLYILFPSSDAAITYAYGNDGANPIVPQQVQGGGVSATTIQVPSGGNYITNPTPGPNGGFILANGQTYSYNTYSESGGVGTFNDVSPNPVNQVDPGNYVYQLDNAGIGYYHESLSVAVPGTVGSVSLGAERVYWLAFYDGSSNIILREGQLAAGEAINVGDTLSTAILTYIGMPSSGISYPTYTSNIRGVANENLTSRAGYLTDAIGDEQEDRSAFFYSAGVVGWNGTTVTFSNNIVLNVLNTKSGTSTTHTLQASAYPSGISLSSGQMFYVQINRTATSENVTGTIASATPAQTEFTKDTIVVFQNISGNLIVPLHKQQIVSGENKYLGGDIPFTGFTNVSGVPQQTFVYNGTTPGYLFMNDSRNSPAYMNLVTDGVWLGGNIGTSNVASLRYALAGDPIAISTGDTTITSLSGNNIAYGIGSNQVGHWLGSAGNGLQIGGTLSGTVNNVTIGYVESGISVPSWSSNPSSANLDIYFKAQGTGGFEFGNATNGLLAILTGSGDLNLLATTTTGTAAINFINSNATESFYLQGNFAASNNRIQFGNGGNYNFWCPTGNGIGIGQYGSGPTITNSGVSNITMGNTQTSANQTLTLAATGGGVGTIQLLGGSTSSVYSWQIAATSSTLLGFAPSTSTDGSTSFGGAVFSVNTVGNVSLNGTLTLGSATISATNGPQAGTVYINSLVLNTLTLTSLTLTGNLIVDGNITSDTYIYASTYVESGTYINSGSYMLANTYLQVGGSSGTKLSNSGGGDVAGWASFNGGLQVGGTGNAFFFNATSCGISIVNNHNSTSFPIVVSASPSGNGQVLFSGAVNGTGTSTGTGWSASNTGLGIYTITFSFGISISAISTTPFFTLSDPISLMVDGSTIGSSSITLYSANASSAGFSAIENGFTFIAIGTRAS
jgi:hypothetical protein